MASKTIFTPKETSEKEILASLVGENPDEIKLIERLAKSTVAGLQRLSAAIGEKKYEKKRTLPKLELATNILKKYRLIKDSLKPNWIDLVFQNQAEAIYKMNESFSMENDRETLAKQAHEVGIKNIHLKTKAQIIAALTEAKRKSDAVEEEGILVDAFDNMFSNWTMKRTKLCPTATNTLLELNSETQKARITLQNISVADMPETLAWCSRNALTEKELYPLVIENPKSVRKPQTQLSSGFSSLMEGYANYRTHVMIMVQFNVSSFYGPDIGTLSSETRYPDGSLHFDIKQLNRTEEATKLLSFNENADDVIENIEKKFLDWYAEMESEFNNLVSKSDSYVVINNISKIEFTMKLVPIAGRGYVLLKRPEDFPEIMNPIDKSGCFFSCILESEFTWKDGYHNLVQKYKLNPATIALTSLNKLADELIPSCRIVVHRYLPKEHRFANKLAENLLYPRVKGERADLHIGYVHGHYFLVRDTSVLFRLKEDDFEVIADSDFGKTMKTYGEIKTYKLSAKRTNKLINGDGNLQVQDNDISSRIDGYIKQDHKANRSIPFDYVTVADVRSLMEQGTICEFCMVDLTMDTWTLDRIDSTLPHTRNNVQLACRHCNSAKANSDDGEFKRSKACEREQHWYTWDVETYLNEHKEHVVYNVGLTEGVPQSNNESTEAWCQRMYDNTVTFYGETAMRDFVVQVYLIEAEARKRVDKRLRAFISWWRKAKPDEQLSDSIIKNKTNRIKEEEKVVFLSYNGSKYDNHFVYKSKGLKFSRIIDANGLISLTLESGLIQFKDVARMSGPGRLSAHCQSYDVPPAWSKTSFPHGFSSKETLNYVGPCPEQKHWEEPIPTEYADKEFDFKKVSIHYQKMDVVCLAVIWYRLRAAMKECTGLDINNYNTIPKLASDFVYSKTRTDDIRICSDPQVDSFIREAIQGGRVGPQYKKYESSSASAIYAALQSNDQALLKNLFETCEDYCQDCDATSLYPSAMCLFDYPVGAPYWCTDLQGLMERLNTVTKEVPYWRTFSSEAKDNTDFPLGIVRCEVTFPNKDIVFPLLSKKTLDGRMIYPLETMTVTKSTIDLMEAVRFNDMKITRIDYAMLWSKRRAYLRDSIIHLIDMRVQAKREKKNALQLCCKTAANSSYGSTIQKVKNRKIEIVGNDDPALKSEDLYLKRHQQLYMSETVLMDEELANGSQSLFEYKKGSRIKVPSHVGVFILAYSKVIMNRFLDLANGFRDWNNVHLYGDTDSMIMRHSAVKLIEEREPSMLKDGLGCVHDDIEVIKNGKIIAGYFIAPKLYCLEVFGLKNGVYTTAYHVRCKGVPKERAKTFAMKEFKALYDGESMGDIVCRIFRSSFKKTDMTGTGNMAAIETVLRDKEINRKAWTGRLYDPATERFLPITEDNRPQIEALEKEIKARIKAEDKERRSM